MEDNIQVLHLNVVDQGGSFHLDFIKAHDLPIDKIRHLFEKRYNKPVISLDDGDVN
jgi:hypothetical protein